MYIISGELSPSSPRSSSENGDGGNYGSMLVGVMLGKVLIPALTHIDWGNISWELPDP